jgi:outer membrane biosynthesis protein TonB
MKSLRIIGISLFIVITALTANAGGPGAKPYPNNLYKHIEKQINYPRSARENGVQGMVLVSFEIDTYGYIKIKEINASDPLLKQHVENKISSIRLCPFDVNSGQVHNMRFNFNLRSNV